MMACQILNQSPDLRWANRQPEQEHAQINRSDQGLQQGLRRT
jgi:hypothetical protein